MNETKTLTVRARVLDNEWTVSIDGGELKSIGLPKYLNPGVVKLALEDVFPGAAITFK